MGQKSFWPQHHNMRIKESDSGKSNDRKLKEGSIQMDRTMEHNHNSVWEAFSGFSEFPQLDHDVNTDVLIIGGGITGILCAFMLEQSGVHYILAEADRICSGITKNTTAKITVQHGLIYHTIMQDYGMEKADLYYRANSEALEKYRKLCEQIDCSFEEKDSCIYSLNHPEQIEAELDALTKLGIQAEYLKDTELPFSVSGAVKLKNQAQFHPLKFLSAIAGNLHIYEHTMVRKIHGNQAVTDHGVITAKKIIVTTHFPFINRHGSYFLKMYQHRSYVIAYEGIPTFDAMYADDTDSGMSFRNFEDQMLIGGGGHRTGKSGRGWAEIRQFAAHHYPDARECAVWNTQDCMTLDHIPYIGNYSKLTPDLYVAAGFNKWGMTSSMAAALILRDRILGYENPYTAVFSPSRSMFKKQLAINMAESSANLLKPKTPRCPHLGCALTWNAKEHSWDCPCHGSTFKENGKLIHNPAMRNLNYHMHKKTNKIKDKGD